MQNSQKKRIFIESLTIQRWLLLLFFLIVGSETTVFARSSAVAIDSILQFSNLPILHIQTNGLSIVDQPKITARLRVIDNGILNSRNDPSDQYDGSIGIELRGESSLTFNKKSYRFETRDTLGENLNVPLLGMPKENDWILYGPYIDKTLLRNSLIFHLGESTGRYSSRMRFCELILNDQYQGVYVLMEKIKRDKHRVSIAELKPEDITGVELTGGYIVRMDKSDSGYVSFKTGITFPNHSQVTLQYYDPAGSELHALQKAWFKQFITDFETSMVKSTFNQPGIGFREYIDAGSFVDFLLTGELALEVDKYKFSTYFFKEKETDGGKLHAGPLWDFDRGFANNAPWPYGQAGDVWQYNEPSTGRCFWWERLMQDPHFRNLCFSRWRYLRERSFSDEAVVHFLDSCALLLENPQKRNFILWPIMGVKLSLNTYVGKNYAEEIAFLKNWTLKRLHWMDENLIGFRLTPKAYIQEIPETSLNSTRGVRLSLKEDFFNRKVFQKDDFILTNEEAFISKDTMLYVNDSTVDVYLKMAFPGADLNMDLSVIVKAKVVESAIDIQSKTLLASSLIEKVERTAYQIISHENQLLIRTLNQGSGFLHLELYDLAGRLVDQQKLPITPEIQVNVRLSKGVYLVRLTDENVKYQARVFIK